MSARWNFVDRFFNWLFDEFMEGRPPQQVNAHPTPVPPDSDMTPIWLFQLPDASGIYGGPVWEGPPHSWTPIYQSHTPEERQALIADLPTLKPTRRGARPIRPPWLNDIVSEAKQSPSGYLLSQDSESPRVQQPTIHYWDEFASLAEQQTTEEETPTLEVPNAMKQRAEEKYKEGA